MDFEEFREKLMEDLKIHLSASISMLNRSIRSFSIFFARRRMMCIAEDFRYM